MVLPLGLASQVPQRPGARSFLVPQKVQAHSLLTHRASALHLCTHSLHQPHLTNSRTLLCPTRRSRTYFLAQGLDALLSLVGEPDSDKLSKSLEGDHSKIADVYRIRKQLAQELKEGRPTQVLLIQLSAIRRVPSSGASCWRQLRCDESPLVRR